MTILILEDNEKRIDIFKVLLEKHICHYFKDVAPAIEYIKNNGMSDVMFLDHDLGGEVYVPSDNDNTGFQFARFLKINKYKCNQIIIHSQNTVGAERMKNELQSITKDLLVIPFPNLVDMMK